MAKYTYTCLCKNCLFFYYRAGNKLCPHCGDPDRHIYRALNDNGRDEK